MGVPQAPNAGAFRMNPQDVGQTEGEPVLVPYQCSRYRISMK